MIMRRKCFNLRSLRSLPAGSAGLAFAALLAAGCSGGESEFEDDYDWYVNGGSGSSSDYYVDSSAGDDLDDFTVEFDYSALTETETVPTDEADESYEDYVENSEFTKTITITYSDGGVQVEGSADDVTVTADGGDVTVNSAAKKVEYVLKGSSADGSFKIYSDKKFKLTLDGVSLTNPTGAAINIQSKKRVFLCLADGTTSTLKDGASYSKVDGEDMKACLFSEGQLLFSGSGTLNVTGLCKHGICSDDYIFVRPGAQINVSVSASNGLKANDAVIINGGVLNIEVTGTAAKGISCDGTMQVSGGRTTIITSGGGELDDDDVSACAGVKCDSTFLMTGGQLLLKSTGAGGKGLSTDAPLTISGGELRVITTGRQYVQGQLDTSPKGVKSDADLTISGGTVRVRTSGGEGSEGIESKANMLISGGLVEVSSYDDALNAAKSITISGGQIYAFSSNNDGIDSNGNLNISGGTVVSVGTQTPEGGLDSDEGIFTLTGGTVIGIGGDCTSPSTSASTQPAVMYKGTGTAGAYTSLLKSDGTPMLTYKTPVSYNQMTLLLSSPDMAKGGSYTLSAGGKVSGGTFFHGLTVGGTWTDGVSDTALTLSSMVTSAGSAGGGQQGMGGQQPGGMGGNPGHGGR